MIPHIRLHAFLIVASSLIWTIPSTNASSTLDSCPGYNATNFQVTDTDLTADLILAGEPCGVYGQDIRRLSLLVQYETNDRIHFKIYDPEETRYEVPEEVFPRPAQQAGPVSPNIKFRFSAEPFSLIVLRVDTNEVLFDTTGYPLIFEPQYLRLKTSLPADANIYGLGEHTDPFRLPNDDHTRTLWTRDSFGVPPGTNLYGSHPVYFEHRTTGSHGVFLLNSNGMDIKLRKEGDKTTLEYNIIGGILDFYFLAGPTPISVAQQYAKVAGYPTEVPYWSFGLHQCRFGYKSIDEVEGVVANYSAAEVPLETMWIDIDYMDDRLVFTTDPVNYPRDRLRKLVNGLHEHNQHFVMMVDPAIGTRPGQDGAFDRGTDMDVWLKGPDGKPHIGIVWPGTVVFPDWFHPSVIDFWKKEFELFFNPESGFDIDGVWIDMNEPASFCFYPCTAKADQVNITEVMLTLGNVPPLDESINEKRDMNAINLQYPPYAIKNELPRLSDRTAPVDSVHFNGLVEYDTHNLYGSMMSSATREAMLARRPGLRPFIITRSTFAGIGSKAGKWLGDNVSNWEQYRFSIAGMLGFASIYQVPMVGSDVCGFVENATETLCARWAMLGAFSPFYRFHNDISSISQEAYRWPIVAQAAKVAVNIRYKLIDYLYTAFHKAHLDGTPVVQPLFFVYPKDSQTFAIDHQFFFGDAVLVSPVLDEGNEVEIYLPDDIFYEFNTRRLLPGPGEKIWCRSVAMDEIPLLIRGGKVLPMRVDSAMTTKELREKDFELVVAPGVEGTASGSLYMDDGVSLQQDDTLDATYTFDGSKLTVATSGTFDAETVQYRKISVLSVDEPPTEVHVYDKNGKKLPIDNISWDSDNEILVVSVAIPLSKSFSLSLSWESIEGSAPPKSGHAHDEL